MCRVEVDGVDEILSYTDINQQTPLQVAVEAGNIENVKVEYLNIENYLFSQYFGKNRKFKVRIIEYIP